MENSTLGAFFVQMMKKKLLKEKKQSLKINQLIHSVSS